MKTWFHYDQHGKYKGKSSDTPPENNGSIGATIFDGILLILLFCVF
jgi:hypothetical protein